MIFLEAKAGMASKLAAPSPRIYLNRLRCTTLKCPRTCVSHKICHKILCPFLNFFIKSIKTQQTWTTTVLNTKLTENTFKLMRLWFVYGPSDVAPTTTASAPISARASRRGYLMREIEVGLWWDDDTSLGCRSVMSGVNT